MISPDVLHGFKMFRDVSAASLQRLSATLNAATLAAGTVVCREAEQGRTLYLIAAGTVAIEKKTFENGGGAKVVARLGAGEFFGEMSFLQGTPHSATVVAQTDVNIIELSRASLDELIRNDSAAALEQVLTLATGLSGRLRSTTRELVTVYEVARAIAAATSVEELARLVVGQLQLDLGPDSSVAFYRWNVFNADLNVIETQGPGTSLFPAIIDDAVVLRRLMGEGLVHHEDLAKAGDAAPFPFKKGHFVVTPVRSAEEKFGLFVYQSDTPASFDAGERQMMETVAAVMIPALSSLQHREEDAARKRLEQSKQGGIAF